MNSPDASRDRLLELLADQAFDALDEQDAGELQGLLQTHSQLHPDTMQEIVAFVELASLPTTVPPLPQDLSMRLYEQAQAFARGTPAGALAGESDGVAPARVGRQPASPSLREWTGWVVAAGLLVALLWSGVIRQPGPDLLQRRRALASATDAVQIHWQVQNESVPAELSGDVTWSNSLQQGYLRFVGLPVNDPTSEQYQLWIIDAGRPDSPPIDGGVFDIDRDGEVVIPIDAKLRVFQPAAFAITIERPGGVVVSDQSRLPLLASVPTAG